MVKNKRKLKRFRVIDSYDIMDICGSYSAYFEVYKGNKYIGIAMFQ